MQKFFKKAIPVIAVQLKFSKAELVYEKWGGIQRATSGDWLLDNRGEVYTVEAETFARTYKETSMGLFIKVTPVWAERAIDAGLIETNEGTSFYSAGDYLVFNNEDETDGYPVEAAKFESMYEPAP